MKKFDLILFDADDTLFDFQKSEKNSLQKTFENFKIEYNEEIETKYNKINKELWEEYNKGNVTKDYLKIERFKRLFNEYNIVSNPEEFNNEYLNGLAENSILIDGVEEICKILSMNYILVIVTNAVSRVAHRKVEKSSISNYISEVVVSDDIGIQKPDIKFFEYVFDRFKNISKDRMIIVGDSLTSDIQGGINAGVESCWYNRFNIENKTEIKPTYEIRDLQELFKIVKGE